MTETNSKPETNGVPNSESPAREVELLSRDAVRYLVKLTNMDRNPNEVPDLLDELGQMSVDSLDERQFDSSETVRLQSTTVEVFKKYLSGFVEPDIDLLFDDEYWDQLREANAEARRALAEQ